MTATQKKQIVMPENEMLAIVTIRAQEAGMISKDEVLIGSEVEFDGREAVYKFTVESVAKLAEAKS